MKKFLSMLIVLVAMVAMVSAADRATEGFVPDGADLTHYPLMNGSLTIDQIADMDLTPVHLDDYMNRYGQVGLDTLVVYNHYRKIDRWVLESLNPQKYKDELLLVDKNGEPRYLQFCGNRIVVLKDCPACPPSTLVPIVPPVTTDPYDGIPWHWLAWLFWLLLLLLLLWALIELLRALWNRFDDSRGPITKDELTDIDDVPTERNDPAPIMPTAPASIPVAPSTPAETVDNGGNEISPAGGTITPVPAVEIDGTNVKITFSGMWEMRQNTDSDVCTLTITPR